MVCSRNFCDYDNYYVDQAGGNLDISYYRGSPYQRGYGVISNLSKRYGIPVLKYLFKHGMTAGKDIYSEWASGKNIRQAAKSSLKKRASSVMKDLGERIEQSGSGLRKKPRINIKRRKTNSKRSSKKQVRRKGRKSNKKSSKFDIFT